MDPKTLNALVHDREAESFDERFQLSYDLRIGDAVGDALERLVGERVLARRALDVGCGTGYLAIGIAAGGVADEVAACDLSLRMLRRTRLNARRVSVEVHPAAADAEALPYRDAAFDLVVARGALHHVPDPLSMLREMRRVLAPDGIAVLLAEPTHTGEQQADALAGLAWHAMQTVRRILGHTPDARRQEQRVWEMASMAANLHTFSPEEVALLAEKAGFTDITVGTALWASGLMLGITALLTSELERLSATAIMRRGTRALADAAAAFDRLVADRWLPARWRHTVQAVLR